MFPTKESTCEWLVHLELGQWTSEVLVNLAGRAIFHSYMLSSRNFDGNNIAYTTWSGLDDL